MATPRHLLVDPEVSLHYHIMSRCVRQSWLLGKDRQTGKNYSHRKQWLVDRIHQLGKAFAIDVDAYAILSNHFHLVVYYDPKAADTWSDREVVDRWLIAFPPKGANGQPNMDLLELKRQVALDNPDVIAHQRHTLGSLSMFMKYLKQPISLRANREDNCDGHFFDKRFYSGALLDDDAILASMAYVDLNPVRAKIVRTLEAYKHTSIAERLAHLKNSSERLKRALAPVVSGLQTKRVLPVTLENYLDRLESLVRAEEGMPARHEREARWRAQVASLRKRQRAYGLTDRLTTWIDARKMRRLEIPLPASAHS